MQKNIALTGGTGRLGSMLVERLLWNVNKLVVVSRDQVKQDHLKARFPEVEFHRGDVTDYDVLSRAFAGLDTVIHCAAMKDPALCEQEIEQSISTNINGTRESLRAALACGVKRFIYISTDMAVESTSVYGHCKALADALVVDAARNSTMKSCVIRLGNILATEKSILTILRDKAVELGYVPITDAGMSRFMMSSTECADYVISIMRDETITGGEIFIPKCPSYDILRVAEAVAENTPIRIIGTRPGDMLAVTMVSSSETSRCRDIGQLGYAIFPLWSESPYGNHVEFRSLTSANNPHRVTVEELRTFLHHNRIL